MKQKILLKDILFNEEKYNLIARQIKKVYSDFESKNFADELSSKSQKLELKQRINLVADLLKKYLPKDYKVAVNILLKSLPEPLNPDLEDNDFGDFIYASYSEFVAKNGCDKKNLEFSLKALKEITKRFSCEYAIRDFINKFPHETFDELLKWSADSNYHVRRLASEGSRPKLPWGKKIHTPITKALPILENLYFDKTRFVVRSVANHLNDISKIDAALVLKILGAWKKAKKQSEKEINFIIRHALRNLIKKGNKGALEFLGVNHEVEVKLAKFTFSKTVKMNENLEFSFVIKAKEDTNLVVDYAINFVNKSGKAASKKTFKLKNFSAKNSQEIPLSKRHKLSATMTTRSLYSGTHELEIMINGKILQKCEFDLV
jgi:3-methyladenine DNA glycosylase AlkC